jgi:hypothetical protein
MEECCPLQEGEEGDFMEEDELGDDGTQEEPDAGPINENQGNPPPQGGGGGAACPGAAAGDPNDPCNPLGNGVENKPDEVMTPEPTTPGAFPGGDDDGPEQDPEDLVVIAAACVAQCNSDYQEFNWVQADLDGCIEGCGDKCLKGCERGYQKLNWTESDRDDCIAGCNGEDNMEEEKEDDNVVTNPDEPTYNDQEDDDDEKDDEFENEDDLTGGDDDEDGEPQPWEVCGLKCKENFLPDSRELFECMSGCDSCVAKCRVDYPPYSSQLYECMQRCGADDDKPIGSDIPPGAIDPAFPVEGCLNDCDDLYDKGSTEHYLCIAECKRDECADKCKKDNPDVASIEYNVCFQDNCQVYQNAVDELDRELDEPGPTPVVTPTPTETTSEPFIWVPTCTEKCELDYPEGAERDRCIRLCSEPPTCEEKCEIDYPEGAQRDECTRLCRKRPLEEDEDEDDPNTQGPTQRPNLGPKCGDADFVYEEGWVLVDGFLVPPIDSDFEKVPIKEYCDGLVDWSEAPVTKFGCTDKDARNYDKDATNDDGSCKIPGCRDPKADNFNAKANEDGGLFPCTYPSQATDPVATPVTTPVTNPDPVPGGGPALLDDGPNGPRGVYNPVEPAPVNVDAKCGEPGFAYPEGWIEAANGWLMPTEGAVNADGKEYDSLISVADFCNGGGLKPDPEPEFEETQQPITPDPVVPATVPPPGPGVLENDPTYRPWVDTGVPDPVPPVAPVDTPVTVPTDVPVPPQPQQMPDSVPPVGPDTPVEIDFLDSKAVGKRFAFILDKSGSMQQGPGQPYVPQPFWRWTVLVSQMIKTLSALPDDTQISIGCFSGPLKDYPVPDAYYAGGGWVTAAERMAIVAFLYSIIPDGSTDPRKCITNAMGLVPPPDAVFLLSDGEFTVEGINPVLGHVRAQLKSTPVRYYCYSVVDTKNKGEMMQIVGESNIACGFKRWDKSPDAAKFQHITYAQLADPSIPADLTDDGVPMDEDAPGV